MAEDKKSVLLYCDIIHTVKELSDEEAGRLFKHYLAYINDLNPSPPDKLTQIVFEPIKQNLKRDLKKWEAQLTQRSEAGKKGMEKRWANKNNGTITDYNTVMNPITNITVKDTVTVTDTVNGKVTVKDKVKETKEDYSVRKLKFSSSLKPFLEIYGKDLLNDFFKYWTEPNKSQTKFRQELEKTWDLERRLETWAKNDKNFNKNEKTSTTNHIERKADAAALADRAAEILSNPANFKFKGGD